MEFEGVLKYAITDDGEAGIRKLIKEVDKANTVTISRQRIYLNE